MTHNFFERHFQQYNIFRFTFLFSMFINFFSSRKKNKWNLKNFTIFEKSFISQDGTILKWRYATGRKFCFFLQVSFFTISHFFSPDALLCRIQYQPIDRYGSTRDRITFDNNSPYQRNQQYQPSPFPYIHTHTLGLFLGNLLLWNWLLCTFQQCAFFLFSFFCQFSFILRLARLALFFRLKIIYLKFQGKLILQRRAEINVLISILLHGKEKKIVSKWRSHSSEMENMLINKSAHN